MLQKSFRALGVRPEVAEALASRGIQHPFPIQEQVIATALEGHDVLAKAPTGSGKTVAFAVPIAQRTAPDARTPAALVLVPTRELAAQVAADLEVSASPMGLRVAAAYGGVPIKGQSKRIAGAAVLVATPGRLKDLVDRRMVSLDRIGILVLDEADRMLDMGFKPQVDAIVRRLPRKRQTMLFSATLDGEVNELARLYTMNAARFEAVGAPAVASAEAGVEHSFVSVSRDRKLERLIEELEAPDRGLALVFVRTKSGAERLTRRLKDRGVAAVSLHGDMAQGARNRALARFRSGSVTTLVATDVAARGLDLDDVTHVINFDPPEDDKGYLHRVGRTGRAGRAGTGITLVLPEQQADVSRVATLLGHREQFELGGMTAARPRRVYTSRRGHRSRW